MFHAGSAALAHACCSHGNATSTAQTPPKLADPGLDSLGPLLAVGEPSPLAKPGPLFSSALILAHLDDEVRDVESFAKGALGTNALAEATIRARAAAHFMMLTEGVVGGGGKGCVRQDDRGTTT